jgi:DNA-directed RNA polymerase beta subunit
MPYTEDGIIPDIIFNPHSIPTRLLTGQIIEASFQLIAVNLCDFVDSTMFSDVSVNDLDKMYTEHGIKDHGNVKMYNGMTGEKMSARVFVAPTNYQRLQKFSITAKYVVNQGKYD